MEEILGEMHDQVMHAVVPYVMCRALELSGLEGMTGGLDLYFYPNDLEKGVGIATQELGLAMEKSPRNRLYNKYELVMFTDQDLDSNQANDEDTPFGQAFGPINHMLNVMARFCEQNKVSAHDVIQLPDEMEDLGGKCFIVDAYDPKGVQPPKKRFRRGEFGMMLIMEIRPDELNYAQKNSSARLISKLKRKGVYPYSIPVRPSVLGV